MLFTKIDGQSADSVTSALNLFSLPSTNVTATKSTFKQWLSLNPISEQPYVFRIHTGSSFIDLSKTFILLDCHIEKQTGANVYGAPETTDHPNVINGIGACFMENLKINLNSREIYNSNGLQGFRSFIDLITTYGKESLPHLQSCGFFEEKVLNDVNDPGYVERLSYVENGQKSQWVSRIFADIFLQDRFLLTQSVLEIEITPRLKDNFCIQQPSTDNNVYRLVIDNLQIFTKNVDVTDGLSLTFNNALLKSPARYPVKKTELKSFFITSGRREFYCNIALDVVPRKVILGFVANANYIGASKLSPFTFENAGIQSIQINANGQQYPNSEYQIDFTENRYARLFHEMQENLGFAYSNNGNLIDFKRYKNGSCLFVFDLSTTMENDDSFELLKSGPTSLLVKFRTPVPAGGFSLIVMSEVDSILTVDSNRTVTTDTTA